MDLSQISHIGSQFDRSMMQSQQSQDDFLTTPRDLPNGLKVINQAMSPKRKKREHFYAVANSNNNSNNIGNNNILNQSQSSEFFLGLPIENKDDGEGPNYIYGMTQDEINLNSQFSQDITDRFGQQLRVNCPEDSTPDLAALNNMNNLGFEDTTSNFSKPPASNNRHKKIEDKNKGNAMKSKHQNQIQHNQKQNNQQTSSDQESRQITVPPPIKNHFLNNFSSSNIQPQSLWIYKFHDRPRYFVDFHQEGILGEGITSVVYSARKRMDGMLYAVKKLKTSIVTEGEKKIYLREVFAHAALQGHPNIVQYFNSWIDEDQLYIQTEICDLGTLDILIEQSNNRYHQNQPKNNLKPTRSDSFDFSMQNNKSKAVSLFSAATSQCSQYSAKENNNINNSNNSLNTSSFMDIGNECDVLNSSSSQNLRSSNSKSVYDDDDDDFINQNSNPNSRLGHDVPIVLDVIESTIWIILSKIGSALHFMHQRGIAHMDIRPANMFLASHSHHEWYGTNINNSQTQTNSNSNSLKSQNRNNKNSSHSNSTTNTTTTATANTTNITNNSIDNNQMKTIASKIVKGECVVKLGDFGLACRLDQLGEIEEGEKRYCAREVINGSGNVDLRKADVFSLGCSVYEIALARPLGWSGDEGSEEWHAIRDGVLDEYNFVKNNRFSPQLVDIVYKMINPEPSLRPSGWDIAVIADRFIASHLTI